METEAAQYHITLRCAAQPGKGGLEDPAFVAICRTF